AGRDDGDQRAEDHQDAADDLDNGHEGRREDRHRDAHRLEAFRRAAEAVDHELLVAVREHDRAEQQPGEQERDVARRAGQWTVHGMTLRYGAPETYPIRVTPFTALAEFSV